MTQSKDKTVHRLRIADAESAVRHVFIRDLALDAHIGVHRHEEGNSQPILVNIDLTVAEGGEPVGDRLQNVVDYESVVNSVEEIVSRGHLRLVETLAELIAQDCLKDQRVLNARIRIEKLAIISNAHSVGVEIERTRLGS
jgi:dihydroneopterin aldolase